MSENRVEQNKSAQNIIDLRAIEIANRAETKVNSYMHIHTERFKIIMDAIKDVKDGQKILFNRWWIAAGSLILLLVSMNGYLISKLIPW